MSELGGFMGGLLVGIAIGVCSMLSVIIWGLMGGFDE